MAENSMKTTTKQVLVAAAWLLTLFGVIGGTLLWQRQVRQPKHPVAAITVGSTTRTPTVILLDAKTTVEQRHQFAAGIQRNNGNQSIISAHISNTGQIKFSGTFKTYDTRPCLQLQLPTKTASISQQATWLKIVLKRAQQQLKFRQFNLVTYGSGGLVATTYLQQTSKLPAPTHLIVIATPFNGTSLKQNSNQPTAVNPSNQTTGLKELIAKQAAISPKIRVLLIAGKTKGDINGDGVIPVQSALAGQAIYRPIVEHYEQHIIHSWHASHTSLYSSWKLANYIQEFIN